MYPGSSGYPGSITEGPKVSGRLVVSGQGMGNDTSDQCRTMYPGKETNLKENFERARRPDRVHNLSGQTLYPGSEYPGRGRNGLAFLCIRAILCIRVGVHSSIRANLCIRRATDGGRTKN